MAIPPITSDRDEYYAELMQFSSQAGRRKLELRSPRTRQDTPRARQELPRTRPEALHLSSLNWLLDQSLEHKYGASSAPHSVTSPLADAEPGSSHLFEDHAAPLMPLRERDLNALVALFEAENMLAMQADVITNLENRRPEPCWEDDPFDFLREYL